MFNGCFVLIMHYRYNVEARILVTIIANNVVIRRLNDFFLLGSCNELIGLTKVTACSCFNFYKNNCIILLSDQINFEMSPAIIHR